MKIKYSLRIVLRKSNLIVQCKDHYDLDTEIEHWLDKYKDFISKFKISAEEDIPDETKESKK